MSTPIANPVSADPAAKARSAASEIRTPRTQLPDDGTRQLLQGAFWTLLTGILAALATLFVFGGVGVHGPHTNGGWLSLIVAMMCLPFGCMLLLLGGAKYLRNGRLARKNR